MLAQCNMAPPPSTTKLRACSETSALALASPNRSAKVYQNIDKILDVEGANRFPLARDYHMAPNSIALAKR